jgi:hypothetical protein
VDGVELNPPRRSFMWLEPVHQEDFRMRAEARLEGQRARGRLSVYFGSILIAEVSLAFRVSSSEPDAAAGREDSRPHRKIFISYSHHDRAVVEQVETFLAVVGDQFLRDSRDLRAGEVWEGRLAEMISEADVFQLFWSTNSMRSPLVRQEWTYARSLGRPSFIRPTYWEDPMPEAPEHGLPPDALPRLHFRYLPAAIAGQAPPDVPARPSPVAPLPPAAPAGPYPSAPLPASVPASGRSGFRRLALIGGGAAATVLVAVVAVSAALKGGGSSRVTNSASPTTQPADFNSASMVLNAGAAVSLSGPITCPANDTAELRATISEPSVGAVGSGTWSGVCTGSTQQWTTVAQASAGPRFVPGCAHGTGSAVILQGATAVTGITWHGVVALTGSSAVNTTAPANC